MLHGPRRVKLSLSGGMGTLVKFRGSNGIAARDSYADHTFSFTSDGILGFSNAHREILQVRTLDTISKSM